MSSLTVLNHEIHQTDGLYCLNDLHKASGGLDKHQPAFFMRNQETKDLIAELENETKLSSANLQTIVKKILQSRILGFALKSISCKTESHKHITKEKFGCVHSLKNIKHYDIKKACFQ